MASLRLSAGAVLTGLALLVTAVTAVPAGAQALTWSVVPSPSPGSGDALSGVSCVSAEACTAVGTYDTSSGGAGTLIESWNGTRWSVVPSPHPGTMRTLFGVSCLSADTCTAVGYYVIARGGLFRTLIESWNGTRWSVVPSPDPGTRRNGNANFLDGVSCVSADSCTAVGYYGDIEGDTLNLIESWNGTTWSVVPNPLVENTYGLNAVSCASADACMAVGHYFGQTSNVNKTLIELWDGTNWSVVPTPNRGSGPDDDLSGVSCASAGACTAVGSYFNSSTHFGQTLIESWNGTVWSLAPSPSRGAGGNSLDAVSCASAGACMAVGTHGNRTLIVSGAASG